MGKDRRHAIDHACDQAKNIVGELQPEDVVTPKRLVLCLDGTWNTVTKTSGPTNVVRFAQSVLPTADGVPQVVYYNAGVGTDGMVDKVLGGVFGVGLKRNVQRAYMFAALNYQPGDELYIF